MSDLGQPSEIITFYSYKGGTGRSMAVANVACILARKTSPRRGVLVIDWDLEAPGLHRFFRGELTKAFGTDQTSSRRMDAHPGLIDLLETAHDTLRSLEVPIEEPDEAVASRLETSTNPSRYIIQTDLPGLSLLKAGLMDGGYASRVNAFPWADIHKKAPWFFSWFLDWIGRRYEYVLIDSRTGLTDTSGICTAILPEKLVLVFTPNRQSIDGALQIAELASDYRRRSDDVRPLSIFPMPSRVDASMEKLRAHWRSNEEVGYQPKFENFFGKAYGLNRCDLTDYFDSVQVQHVPDFAYGEQIAVLSDLSSDRFSLVNSYEEFTDKLTRGAAAWEAEVARYYSCLISSALPDEAFVQKLFSDLLAQGVRCLSISLDPKARKVDQMFETIQNYDRVILILSAHSVRSFWMAQEIDLAFKRERELNDIVLCPIRVDNSIFQSDAGQLKQLLQLRQVGDFSKWIDPAAYSSAFQKLLNDLDASRWKPKTDPIDRMLTALLDERYRWRSIERLAILAGLGSEQEALDLLRSRPEVVFGKAKSGRRIARLRTR